MLNGHPGAQLFLEAFVRVAEIRGELSVARRLPPWLVTASAALVIQRCYRGFRGRQIYWQLFLEEQELIVREVQKQLQSTNEQIA